MKPPIFVASVTLIAMLLLMIYGMSVIKPTGNADVVDGHKKTQESASLVPAADFGNPSIGPSDAPLTIFIYGDFECPACATLDATLREVIKDFDGKVRLVWKDLPNTASHPHAMDAAVAARCAREQDAFWEYHDLLMSNQDSLNEPSYSAFASQLGLDGQAFSACLTNRTTEPLVTRDIEEAIRLGVDATPYLFIGETRASGSIIDQRLRTMISSALAR